MVESFSPRTTAAARQAFEIQVIFYVAFLVITGPLVLGASWLLSRERIRLRVLALLSLPGVLWAWFLFSRLSLWATTPSSVLWWWWGGLIPVVPLGVLVIRGWRVMFGFLRPRDLDEHLAEQQQLLEWQQQKLSRQAEHLSPVSAARPNYLTLGVFMKGDIFPPHLKIVRESSWLQMEESLLSQHLLILGTTGAGKTEAIKRLIAETLRTTERDIFFIDGKGDEALGREVAQMLYAKSGQPTPIFKLGFAETGAVYHGFRGERSDIYNRLCALVGVEEASGDARYYADVNRDLLQLICQAGSGPPRSFEELRERLSKSWLKSAYRNDPTEIETLSEMDDHLFESLAIRVRPLAREFAPVVGEEGFVLEESRGAVFSLRTQSVGDTARRFLQFFVEDIKDFIGKRQQRPALLIIDEFGAFNNENIVAILALARSSNLGVILATQDVSSLGEEQIRRQILANTRTRILMATDFPEEVAELAGTKYQIEASIQHEDGEATGMGSARVQHTFRVDMNDVRSLQAGEAFLIRQGHAAKLRFSQVGAVDIDERAIARFEKRVVKQQAKKEPVRKEKKGTGKPRGGASEPNVEKPSAPRKAPPKLDF